MKAAPTAPFIRLFGRYLREQGLPVTQQREAVAEVVFGSEEHLSVLRLRIGVLLQPEVLGRPVLPEHDGPAFRRLEAERRAGLVVVAGRWLGTRRHSRSPR